MSPGDLLSGFSIDFTWLGGGTPGSQPFSLYDDFGEPTDLPVDLTGYNLFTQPLRTTPVPEPGTVFLLGSGLLGIAAMRRRRPTTR